MWFGLSVFFILGLGLIGTGGRQMEEGNNSGALNVIFGAIVCVMAVFFGLTGGM